MPARKVRFLILVTMLCAATLCSAGASQYSPQWRVGDWWVTKTWEWSKVLYGPWSYMRYDITGLEKVGNHKCYVLETRFQTRDGTIAETHNVLYVRTDNWLVVRQVMTAMYNGKLRPPTTMNCPLGLFGPFGGGEPRLPRFPLRPGSTDTTFRLQQRDDFSAYLREISCRAESALIKRILDEGDTTGGQVVRPTGDVFQVRNELGGDIVRDPRTGKDVDGRVVQSLQLWCTGLPWRVYEEEVQLDGLKDTRLVVERTWLIASGHSAK